MTRKFGMIFAAAVMALGFVGATGTAQADPPWQHDGAQGGWHRDGGDHGGWQGGGWQRRGEDDGGDGGGWGGPQVYVQGPPQGYYAPPPPVYYDPPPPPPAYYAPPPPAYYAPPVVSFGLSLPFGDGDGH